MPSAQNWKVVPEETPRAELKRLCKELEGLPTNIGFVGHPALSNVIPIVQLLTDLVLPPDPPQKKAERKPLDNDATEDQKKERRALDELDLVNYQTAYNAYLTRLDKWRKPWKEVLDIADRVVDGPKSGVSDLLGKKK